MSENIVNGIREFSKYTTDQYTYTLSRDGAKEVVQELERLETQLAEKTAALQQADSAICKLADKLVAAEEQVKAKDALLRRVDAIWGHYPDSAIIQDIREALR